MSLSSLLTRHSQRNDNCKSNIEKIVLIILKELVEEKNITLSYDDRKSSNSRDCGKVTRLSFISPKQVRKLVLSLKLLAIIYNLLQAQAVCTKRDIYYRNVTLYRKQSVVDDIVENIALLLHVPRWRLNVLATSKGLVAGNLIIRMADGSTVDYESSQSGILVPSSTEDIVDMHSNASSVLVIEKDATFESVLDAGFCEQFHPCIIVTGKGYPDVNTRMFLHKLLTFLPVSTLCYALVDADPHGIDIMCVYKFGSRAMSFEADSLTVPSLQWLGILPSDIQRFQLGNDVLARLTEVDMSKAQSVLRRLRQLPTRLPVWESEVEILVSGKMKAEIQSLTSISPQFLVESYLPAKIKYTRFV